MYVFKEHLTRIVLSVKTFEGVKFGNFVRSSITMRP